MAGGQGVNLSERKRIYSFWIFGQVKNCLKTANKLHTGSYHKTIKTAVSFIYLFICPPPRNLLFLSPLDRFWWLNSRVFFPSSLLVKGEILFFRWMMQFLSCLSFKLAGFGLVVFEKWCEVCLTTKRVLKFHGKCMQSFWIHVPMTFSLR